MRNLVMIITCFCTSFVYAQEKDSTAHKTKWTNIVQIGQIFDNNEGVTGRLTGTLASGIQRGKLSTGIELGFNNYGVFNLGSIALYGKYRVFEKGLSPYGYGLLGYGHPVYFKDDAQIDASNNSNGGLLYGAGVGVDYPLGKVNLLFQLGYKFQKTSYDEPPTYYYYDWLSSFALYGGDQNYITRKMSRIEFKVGIQF